MNFKKLLSSTVATLVCIASLPFNVIAADTESDTDWDGSADITWYDGEETVQYISSASELAGLAVLVNEGRNMEGQTIILEDNISLKGSQWTPIGKPSHPFYGTFDGNYHTISGLTIVCPIDYTPTENDYCFGLFGGAEKSTIQNLIVNDASFSIERKDITPSTGLIVSNGGSVLNCLASGSLNYSITRSTCNIGGIAGAAHEVRRCKSNVDISINTVEQCDIRCGGVCGVIGNKGAIDECCNYGSITFNGDNKWVSIAGVVGLIGLDTKSVSSVTNCYNRADITSSSDSCGILGRLLFSSIQEYNYIISNVYNTGKCTYGVYGYTEFYDKMENLYYSSTSATKGTNSAKDKTTPKPINNMKKDTFVQSLGGSFAYVENDLPVLKWELDSPLTNTTTTTETTTTNTETTTTTEATTTTTTTTATTTETEPVSTTTIAGELSVPDTEVSLSNGEQYTITANRDDVTFESNNKAVAVVNSKGIITALGEGTAIISVITPDYDVVQIKVTVAPAQSTALLGDPNNDGKIDAKDATFILAEYAKLSTGAESSLTEAEKTAADVNKDGKSDAKDASAILAFYAYVSTGGSMSLEDYLK